MKHKDLKAEWGVCVCVFGGWGSRWGESEGRENGHQLLGNRKATLSKSCL